tara:strand:+ start:1242 stop:2351 length:1110 start_codon:yes stop_codon:yes gene_type:complete
MIPVNKPEITKVDAQKVYKAVKEGWVSSSGPQVKVFENKIKKFVGKKYSSAVANGTAALEIAIKTLNLKKNDEVIIPNFTIISNALAVIKQNAKLILIDCDLQTWNMKIDMMEKAINKNTKAIIATHIYGYPIEIDKIKKICKKKKIILIEDAAEMFGHKYKNKYCGYYGDISVFSFYANKHITTGEGGMILTNDKAINDKINDLRNLCFGKINRFNHDDIGWNYRFTNLQAALGLSQLKRINNIIKKKKEIGKLYYKLLSKNKTITIQKPKLNNLENIYWVVGIIIKKKINVDILRKKLFKFGIETRSFFWPMNKQKIFKKLKIKFKGSFPNSNYISKYGFYLPSGIGTTSKDISFVCKKINQVTKNL